MKINIPTIFVGFVLVLAFCMNAFADQVVVRTPTVPQRYQAPPAQQRYQQPYQDGRYQGGRYQQPQQQPTQQYRRYDQQQDCRCCNCDGSGTYNTQDPIEAFFNSPAVRQELARAQQAGYTPEQNADRAFLKALCGVAGCSETYMVTVAVRPQDTSNPQTLSVAAIVTVQPQVAPIVRLVNVQSLVR